MDFRRHLKHTRAKPRRPFTRTAFTVVNSLIWAYKLDASFLNEVVNFSIWKNWLASFELKAKDPVELPLFSLASEQDYRLTQAILAVVANPYLSQARSPEEMLLSGPLFCLNPELSAEVLARVHFRVLLARETALIELRDLQQQLKKQPASADKAMQPDEVQTRLASLEHLLKNLNTFIDQIKVIIR
jgi:hypothetical protein